MRIAARLLNQRITVQAGGELVHVISFLLQMGFREVGVPFPLEGLNPLQANIAAQLSQLGLLMPFRCPFFLPHALRVTLFLPDQLLLVAVYIYMSLLCTSLPPSVLIAKGPSLGTSAPNGLKRSWSVLPSLCCDHICCC